jgi:fructose-1,6-bisphosphatase/inositol monophosphatase family enzyme
MDPIDGTRGLMYDKRSAWALAAVAPNKGAATRLSDCFASVMTELPTSKMGRADVLTAVRGQGAICRRVDLRTEEATTFRPTPSRATNLSHGFASVAAFFPGTKVAAAELLQHIARPLLERDEFHAGVLFDDQYISTGGQWYEVLVGHDRFVADVRPALYRKLGLAEGMSCHPYDCAGLLVAEEAGVVVHDATGRPLDAPLDLTSNLDWVAYSNETIRAKVEPLLLEFLQES